MAQKLQKSRSKSTLLDQKFWSHFAKSYWEKKSLHLKNVKSGLLEMSDSEIFDLLVLYADHCREMNDPSGFKFYTDGIKADEEQVLEVLPEATDKSLLGYHKRMNSLFPDYCLVCDELLQVNLKKQHLLTDFTDDLYRHVGFPNRFSEMGLYLGNYKKTPFGVHVDSCGVFSFPVSGLKKFRLWPAAYGEKHPELDRTFNYEKHKKHSLLLEAVPGDMTYWPSSEWHIAESDGSFSATWSLGVWVDQPHKQLFSNTLNDLLDSKSGALAAAPMTKFESLHSAAGEVAALPEAYRQSIETLQKLTPAEIQETFLKSWMKHISMQGFKTNPLVDFKLTAKSNIQLRNKKTLILWQQSQTSKNKVFFAFGGVLIEKTPADDFLKLVKSLNDGKSCSLQAYLKDKTRKHDLQSLQMLAEAGAFSLTTGK